MRTLTQQAIEAAALAAAIAAQGVTTSEPAAAVAISPANPVNLDSTVDALDTVTP